MWKWVRISKSVALLAFLLPWLTVSCSGQKMASVSGLSLLTGRLSVSNPMTGASETMNGSPSLLLLMAAIAIGVGLYFAFSSDDGSDKAAPVALGTSAGALALIVLATIGINGNTIARAATASEPARERQFSGPMANAMISVDYALGFWIAVLALAAGAAIAWQVWQERTGGAGSAAIAGRFGALAVNLGSAGDTAHWDKIADKNDADSLQEYLIRYPNGRFSELARQKLARMNVEPLASAPTPAEPQAEPQPEEPVAATRTCPQCGTSYGPETSFCTKDGAALA